MTLYDIYLICIKKSCRIFRASQILRAEPGLTRILRAGPGRAFQNILGRLGRHKILGTWAARKKTGKKSFWYKWFKIPRKCKKKNFHLKYRIYILKKLDRNLILFSNTLRNWGLIMARIITVVFAGFLTQIQQKKQFYYW